MQFYVVTVYFCRAVYKNQLHVFQTGLQELHLHKPRKRITTSLFQTLSDDYHSLHTELSPLLAQQKGYVMLSTFWEHEREKLRKITYCCKSSGQHSECILVYICIHRSQGCLCRSDHSDAQLYCTYGALKEKSKTLLTAGLTYLWSQLKKKKCRKFY